jgi:SNF2 family DNA or RNA helicase
VVVDEAHRITSAQTVQTRAVWAVSASAQYRWALTATPMEQSMTALWPLLHFVAPDEWTSSTKYRDRWALQHTNFFGVTEVLGLRPDRLDEFHDVTGWRWMRRLKSDTVLPPKQVEYRYGDLSPKEAKAYRSMAKQLAAEVEGGVLVAENHMVKTTRLLQLASSWVQVEGDMPNQVVTPMPPSSKLDLMEDTLGDFAGEPVVLWFKHVGVLKMAEERITALGRSCVTLYGDRSAEERQAAVEAFQNGEVDTILVSVGAGSEGITLTRSRVAICVERDWSSIKNAQLEDRIHRIGSEIHDDVLIVNLVMRGTIEEALYDALQSKAETIQEVLRDYANQSV